MRKFAAAALTLALLAGCGGDKQKADDPAENAPSAKALLQESFKASRNQHKFKFSGELTLAIQSTSRDPEIQRISGDPIKLNLTGAYQKTPPILELKGSAYYLGQTFTAALLAGDREAYFQLLGKWYGTKDTGLSTFKQSLDQNQAEQQRVEKEFFTDFERLFKGEVTEGPKSEGKETWKLTGSLDPEAVIQEIEEVEVPASDGPPPNQDPNAPPNPNSDQSLPQDAPKKLTEEEKQAIRSLVKLIHFSYVADKQQQLFREFKVEISATKAELQELAKHPDFKQAGELEALKVTLLFKAFNYGDPVEFKPPAQFQPLGDLLGEDSLEGFNPLNLLGIGGQDQGGQEVQPPADPNSAQTSEDPAHQLPEPPAGEPMPPTAEGGEGSPPSSGDGSQEMPVPAAP